MRRVCNVSTAVRAAGCAALMLGVAACAIPDFSQVSLPRADFSGLLPTNANQYARWSGQGAVSADELVDSAGHCANAPAAAAGAGADVSAAPPPAIRGVGLEMTECDVVRALGQPESAEISANQRGERSVVMTYATPERPTYRFVSGRLVSIERGAEPPPEPAKKKPAAKKPAKKPQPT